MVLITLQTAHKGPTGGGRFAGGGNHWAKSPKALILAPGGFLGGPKAVNGRATQGDSSFVLLLPPTRAEEYKTITGQDYVA